MNRSGGGGQELVRSWSGVHQTGVCQAGVRQAGVRQAGVRQPGVRQAGVHQAGVCQAGVHRGLSGVHQESVRSQLRVGQESMRSW